ncbi:olfactory receptor 1J2-like [Diceros bicornis minor]|uniref:olfactory receptor 1J2-like n=1 Tax=Diceros bicornis minor TaxID=77932 RepID=UPI0026ECE39C|nr:olfactory receptor 1J2-like [Diceros bicornis minor]
MWPDNRSSVSEFLLLGFPILPEQQDVFFALFLSMYLTTVLGNLLIILLISLDSHLHTPMYFFLSHLAFSDISFSSITVPKMLMNMQTQCHSITYAGCISQVYFFIFFGCLDSFLLAVMAYDRYVAICHPLHYTIIMRDELCVILVAGSWFSSCAQALLHTLLVDQLSFCAGTVIPHFFCDLSVVLKSSCSDTSLNELLILTEGGLIFSLPLSAILGSYIRMAVVILKVPTLERISKALSTCVSHLFVVFLYYGTIAGVYYFPSSGSSKVKDIIASLMYMVVTPMLNPFIYSLRNKDMKCAFQKIFRTKDTPWCH